MQGTGRGGFPDLAKTFRLNGLGCVADCPRGGRACIFTGDETNKVANSHSFIPDLSMKSLRKAWPSGFLRPWMGALLLALALVGAGSWLLLRPEPAAAAPMEITVYKSPTCPCCHKWVEHFRAKGYEVKVHDTDDLQAVKSRLGVPAEVTSCHTSQVGGYTVEGHVPEEALARLLRERPPVHGIGVAGMPLGSPGMEAGGRTEPYQVRSFDRSGKTALFLQK